MQDSNIRRTECVATWQLTLEFRNKSSDIIEETGPI